MSFQTFLENGEICNFVCWIIYQKKKTIYCLWFSRNDSISGATFLKALRKESLQNEQKIFVDPLIFSMVYPQGKKSMNMYGSGLYQLLLSQLPLMAFGKKVMRKSMQISKYGGHTETRLLSSDDTIWRRHSNNDIDDGGGEGSEQTWCHFMSHSLSQFRYIFKLSLSSILKMKVEKIQKF